MRGERDVVGGRNGFLNSFPFAIHGLRSRRDRATCEARTLDGRQGFQISPGDSQRKLMIWNRRPKSIFPPADIDLPSALFLEI